MSIQSAEVHRPSGSGSGSDHAPICALALAPRTAQPPRRSDRPAGRGVAAASGKMVPTSDVPAKLTLLIMLLIAVIDHGEGNLSARESIFPPHNKTGSSWGFVFSSG
uniref:Uncharacterized protein n=1 Tax=Anopheles melas TaxID=34690 RepID=A0A182UB83_9DIPT